MSALKIQLQTFQDERDNLRDEVVPQLRARVEGLEAQAAEHEKLTYEYTKIQQELQALRCHNITLINSQKLQMKKLDMLSENSELSIARRERSASCDADIISSLSSRTVTLKPTETRDALAERVKDIELQRDSLHAALKSLLERQEHQNRESGKTIKLLETELEKALSVFPKLFVHEKEVKNLRSELKILRTRADEAISKKMLCEKSFVDVKIGLDHAEKRIFSLKKMISQENKNCQAPLYKLSSVETTPKTFEGSYKDLKTTYSESLEQVKSLKSELNSKQTLSTLELNEQSLINFISEHNFATCEAGNFKNSNKVLNSTEKALAYDSVTQSNNLFDFAKNSEELAAKARQRISMNSKFRQRFATAIENREREQVAGAQKFSVLQTKLNSLKEQITHAKQITEERLTAHEEDISEIKENQILQLQRIKGEIRLPMSPKISRSIKSPNRINFREAVADDVQVENLRHKIVELEETLLSADKEMEKLVSRMNSAQIEVMNLQNEREEAIRETKRLQLLIETEKSQSSLNTWTSMLET